ncbi:DUF1660 family phage protein [Lactococcus lactis]
MKLMCKLFGHDYDPPALIGDEHQHIVSLR